MLIIKFITEVMYTLFKSLTGEWELNWCWKETVFILVYFMENQSIYVK